MPGPPKQGIGGPGRGRFLSPGALLTPHRTHGQLAECAHVLEQPANQLSPLRWALMRSWGLQ
jgi:hypothetical protein